MAAGVALLSVAAIVVARGRPSALQDPVAWGIAAVGLAVIVAGFAVDGTDPRRRLVALALREAGGVFGAALTFLTGAPVWAAGLGALAVAAILAGLPPPAGDPRPR